MYDDDSYNGVVCSRVLVTNWLGTTSLAEKNQGISLIGATGLITFTLALQC
jgi:hypothetical protein